MVILQKCGNLVLINYLEEEKNHYVKMYDLPVKRLFSQLASHQIKIQNEIDFKCYDLFHKY